MAAQTLGSTSTTGYAVPRVNLLPPEISEKSRLRRAKLAMVGTGLAAAAVVGVLYAQQAANVSKAQHAKDEAAAKSVELRDQLDQLKTVQQTKVDVDNARTTLAAAMKNEVYWSKYLHDVQLTIPETVWLTSFTVTMNDGSTPGAAPATGANGPSVLDAGIGTVAFDGVAMTHNDVAAWLESLGREKGYANPYFTDASDLLIGKTEVVKFSSTASITPAALSNRYTKGLDR